jgi:hypothetical protein
VARLAGGFAVGPISGTDGTGGSALSWVRIDPDGQTQTMYSTSYDFQGFFQMLDTDTPTRLVSIEDFGAGYWTALLDVGQAMPVQTAKLMDGAHSSLSYALATASLDGKRALFMSAEIGGHAPWLATFASDGTPVGDLLQTTVEGDCYRVLPTEHGALFTVLDGSSTFHLIEFDATGAVTFQTDFWIDQSEPRVRCPVPVLTDTGFAYVTFGTDDTGGHWYLSRLERSGLTTSFDYWPALGACSSFAMAMRGNTAIATCSQADQAFILEHTIGGSQADRQVPLERNGLQIPSEPGSLFVDVTHPPATASSAPTREILEIQCAD